MGVVINIFIKVFNFIYNAKIKMKHLIKKVRHSPFYIGIASLLWLLYKSGTKPDRMRYPCQKAAAANVTMFLFPILSVYVYKLKQFCRQKFNLKKILKTCIIVSLLFISVLIIEFLCNNFKDNKNRKYYESLKKFGPIGKPLCKIGGAVGLTFGTISHALSLPSPHRVVSIHNTNATSWHFPCTGPGSCPYYYGSDEYVSQTIVDKMMDKGIMALTGTLNLENAWKIILPDYQSGEKIAVKVNFNDSVMGGGSSGYGDDDAYVDALPQIINSMVRGLKTIGVQEQDICIYDATRHITDRFRARILYPCIKYFDKYGNGSDIQITGFTNTEPTAQINFSNSGYTGSHKITDVLVEAKYLINIPIFKRHGGAGITLSFKNHLGSLDFASSNPMHSYIYLNRGDYNSASNPIVDINNNPHIKNKTVLIIGDALYGAWPDNNEPPSKWSSFNNDSPNMLFFSVDPVAVDSVMYDYLVREGSFDSRAEDILILAAEAGMGIHERWNNNNDRKYTGIDYIEIDMDIYPIVFFNKIQGEYVGDLDLKLTAYKDATKSELEPTATIVIKIFCNDKEYQTHTGIGTVDISLPAGAGYKLSYYTRDIVNNTSLLKEAIYTVVKKSSEDIAINPTVVNLNEEEKIKFIYKNGQDNMIIKICTLREDVVKEITGVDFSTGSYEYSTKNLQSLPTGQYIIKIGNKKTLFTLIK